MKTKLILIAMCGLLGACAPQNQIAILNDHRETMDQVDRNCTESNQNKTATALAECRFSGYRDILSQADFKDMGLFVSMKNSYLRATHQLDDKKITWEQAQLIFTQADYDFVAGVQRHDEIRERNYKLALLAAAGGLNQYNQNNPPPSFNASQFTCTACETGRQQGEAMVNYVQPFTPSSVSLPDHQPTPLGAEGYAGRTYVPVDPALTPGLTPDGYAK